MLVKIGGIVFRETGFSSSEYDGNALKQGFWLWATFNALHVFYLRK
jgi:hypothetical protein